MLMNMESLLQTARKHHFAVGAFNVCDSLLFSTVMECAEEQHAPVIVELAQDRQSKLRYTLPTGRLCCKTDAKQQCSLCPASGPWKDHTGLYTCDTLRLYLCND